MARLHSSSLALIAMAIAGCNKPAATPVVTFVIAQPRAGSFQINNVPGSPNPAKTANGDYVLHLNLSASNSYDASRYPHGQWVKIDAITNDGKPITANIVKPGAAFEFTLGL